MILMVSSVTPIFISDFTLLIINFSIVLFFMNGVISGNWSLVMDVINPKISASEHEIICSIVNLGGIVIGSVTGSLFVLLGTDNLFILSGVITLIALLIFIRIRGVERIRWPSYIE